MQSLKYLSAYPEPLKNQVQELITQNRLADFLLQKHPRPHEINNDKSLRDYVMDHKNRYLKKSDSLSKVVYDPKIHIIHNALGVHRYVSRVQGGKLKSKHEIRIGTIFKNGPEAFLNMIVVHELAHLKEKEHSKAFYQLCRHMLPDYHQLEFETRLYLTQLELYGAIYT